MYITFWTPKWEGLLRHIAVVYMSTKIYEFDYLKNFYKSKNTFNKIKPTVNKNKYFNV